MKITATKSSLKHRTENNMCFKQFEFVSTMRNTEIGKSYAFYKALLLSKYEKKTNKIWIEARNWKNYCIGLKVFSYHDDDVVSMIHSEVKWNRNKIHK